MLSFLERHASLRRRFGDARRRSIRANRGRRNLDWRSRGWRRLGPGHEGCKARDADLHDGPDRADVELGVAGKLDHDPGGSPDGGHAHPPHRAVVDDLRARHTGRVGIGDVDDDPRRRQKAQRREAQGPIADELDDRGLRVARRPHGEKPPRSG